MKIKTLFLTVLGGLMLSLLVQPQGLLAVEGSPPFVDYQGTVYSSTTGDPLGGADPTNYTMQFRIYSQQSGGDLIWSETQTVTVDGGAFSVRLGLGAKIANDPAQEVESIANAFAEKDRFLELTVVESGDTSGNPIRPRLAFQSSPFSFAAEHAKMADSVNGVVTATEGSTFTGTEGQPTTFNGPVSATDGISGNLTGDVTGNATSATTAANVTGTVAVANGGTGSTTKNFVDLTTSQNIAGNKNFTGRVGIGTKLQISGVTDYNNGLKLIGTGFVGMAIETTGGSGGKWALFTDSYGNLRILDDSVGGGDRLLITGTGNVGIGSTNPTKAKLVVEGSANPGAGLNYGYLVNGGGTGPGTTGANTPYSIWASDRIAASEIDAFSDERIKKIQGRSDSVEDLNTLIGIEITNYRYKDVIRKGNDQFKKVIAQQVERVFPQAVRNLTDVVPDIYRRASIKDGWVELATDLKKGERVRLISDKDEENIHEVLEVRDGAFRTAFNPSTEKVFVYGREVKDFRTVDYNAIAMLNVSATQQIKKEKDAEVKALQEENSELRTRLGAQERRLAALEARDEARDVKLAALERLLAPAGEASTLTVSLQGGGGVE